MPHLVAALNEIGQSLWLDSISRSMLRDDTLATYRGQHGVTAVSYTHLTLPTIYSV